MRAPPSGARSTFTLVPFTPYDAGVHGIQRARRLLDTADPKGGLPIGVRGDLRRLSVVMAVAALDTYMHRLIVERAYTHEELPGGLAKLDVPFEQLLAQADECKVAARRKPHNSRPRVAVKRQLRDRLLRETFQRYEDVSRALGMVGRKGSWDEIGRAMVPAMARQEIRIRLNAIVVRRNQIVHEGDYKRLERPRNPSRNGIGRTAARNDIDFIDALINAIHAVV
jgi:hypothetical protein